MFFLNYLPILLFTVIALSILITIFLKNNVTQYWQKLFSFFLGFIILLFFILILIKMSIFIFCKKYNLEIVYTTHNFILNALSIDFNSFLISDIILLLSYFSGIICLQLLSDRGLVKYLPNITIFSIFFLSTIILVYTTNLLVMFFGFEFIFFPTIYYAYILGYTKKIDRSIKITFMWTGTGAFLVLCSLAYIYYHFKTLDYYNLINIHFSNNEKLILGFIIFIGFAVKIPTFPFHFWLTKIHVEAPAGFSIFLSGFLVKAAVYCLYLSVNIFNTSKLTVFIILLAMIGIIESSCKMWVQTDFKKLIAFATIQEMNMILLLWVTLSNHKSSVLAIFILMHGVLSTLMFFLVDVIQKKTKSRNITSIGGVALSVPQLKNYIWLMLVFMSGFPLTVKFTVEASLISTLITNSFIVSALIIFAALVFGPLGFFKQIFIILYNQNPRNHKINPIISKRDIIIFNVCVFVLISLNFLFFFIVLVNL